MILCILHAFKTNISQIAKRLLFLWIPEYLVGIHENTII